MNPIRAKLLIVDHNEAIRTGIQVVRWVRHAPVANDTPVVLLSDDGSASRTVEALEAGANGLLAKPFSTSRLCDRVTRIIASHAPVAETGPANRVSREDTWSPLHSWSPYES